MLFTSKDFENINRNGKKSDFTQDDIRLFAIPSNGYNIELDPNKLHSVTIEETNDNSCLINELNDCIESTKQVYLPKLVKLMNVANDENAPDHVIEVMKTSKEALEYKLSRYKRLIIIRNDLDEDTADFEEVEEDTSLLDDISSCSSYSLEKLINDQNRNQQNHKKDKFKLLSNNSPSQTNQTVSDADCSQQNSKTNQSNDVFESINHICGVKLPSGKLCSRQDRYKCPFHGKIIKRDEKGNVFCKEEKIKLKKDVDFLMDVVSTSNGNYKLIPKVNNKKTLKRKISKPSSLRKRLEKKMSKLKH